jgi:hypothetical protein
MNFDFFQGRFPDVKPFSSQSSPGPSSVTSLDLTYGQSSIKHQAFLSFKTGSSNKGCISSTEMSEQMPTMPGP